VTARGFLSSKARGSYRLGAKVLLLSSLALLVSCQAGNQRRAGFYPLFHRGSGLISYVTSDGNIALIDQRGGSMKSITSDAGPHGDGTVYNVAPAWSPDAKRIAFAQITLAGGSSLVNASLISAEASSGRREQLLSGTRIQPFYLFWSPDSRAISLLSQVQGEDALELGIATAGMAGSYHGIDRGAPYYWDWLKNSQGIVVHTDIGRTGESRERLSLVHVATGTPRTDFPVEAGLFQAPAVSPDGRSIAYVTTAPDGFVLHARTLDSAAERVLARDLGGAFFSFSPDGKRIAYLAARVAQPVPLGKLTIVDVKGSIAAQAVEQQPVLAFFWSPDGRNLAYFVPASTGDLDPLFLAEPGHLSLQLMGCNAATGKTWPIARFPLSPGMLNALPFFDQYQRSSSIWSPDSRSIVFTALSADGRPGVYVVPADGSITPRFLTSGDFAYWSPR
jgi:TolB protein